MVWIYAFTMVLLSAVVGGLTVHIVGTRRGERADLLADIDAAETAPVPVVADITSFDLEPLPPDAPAFAFTVYLPVEEPWSPLDGWQTTAATTGDLSYVRQQLDLDDFALWMEKGFHDLLEQVRDRFDAIQITG